MRISGLQFSHFSCCCGWTRLRVGCQAMTSEIFHYILMGIVVIGLVFGAIYLARHDTAAEKYRK